MTIKNTLRHLFQAQRSIESAIVDITIDHVPVFHRVSPTWNCPDSPIGYCIYHTIADPASDQCIHCGDPLERK